MKTTTKLTHLLLALMFCGLTGCSQAPQKLIVGTWALKSVSPTCPYERCDGAIVYHFLPDGTLTSSGSAVGVLAESRTYSLPDGQHLKMTGAFGTSFVWNIKSLTSKELSLGMDMEGQGHEAVLTFVRAK